MSAAQALQVARSAGIKVRIEGDDLLLEAAGPPPAAVLDLLSHNKKGILAILRPGRDGWSAEDWHVFFDERASIAEFDGRVPRSDAEARAFACCIVEWLNRCVRRPDGASAAAIMSTATIRCCPTASNQPGTPGCIRAAGRPGTPHGRGRPSRHSRQRGLGMPFDQLSNCDFVAVRLHPPAHEKPKMIIDILPVRRGSWAASGCRARSPVT
jgi:hypothetical protein